MMKYRNPLYESGYDFPRYTGEPRCSYFVATTPRSGSSLLALLCRQTGSLGFPLEYFSSVNMEIMRQRFHVGARASSGYADELISLRTTPNGVFGLKLHYGDLAHFESMAISRVPLAEGRRVILLEREDRLSQAISLVIASQTNKWIDLPGFEMQQTAPGRYDRVAIATTMQMLDEHHQSWRALVRQRGCKVLQLTYEQLLQDCFGTFSRISHFLEVEASYPALASVEIEKQGDELNSLWKRQFLQGK